MIVNLVCVSVLSLGTGFTHTFSEFLAVRSLVSPTTLAAKVLPGGALTVDLIQFGIAMGGIWGQSAGLAL